MNTRVLVRREPPKTPAQPAAIARPVAATPVPLESHVEKPSAAEEHLADQYGKFKTALQIERSNLDAEAADQAQLYFAVGEHYTTAVSLRDQARDNLAAIDARLAHDERRRLANAGEKVTEGIINDYVMLHRTHTAEASRYERLKTISDKWGNLQRAYEQRMRMLRELVNLFVTGYWTTGAIKPRTVVNEAVVANIRQQQADRRAGRG